MIVRKDEMRASKVMQERVIDTPNIKITGTAKQMKFWARKK